MYKSCLLLALDSQAPDPALPSPKLQPHLATCHGTLGNVNFHQLLSTSGFGLLQTYSSYHVPHEWNHHTSQKLETFVIFFSCNFSSDCFGLCPFYPLYISPSAASSTPSLLALNRLRALLLSFLFNDYDEFQTKQKFFSPINYFCLMIMINFKQNKIFFLQLFIITSFLFPHL
jgi:hypothetical protein